MINSKDDNHNSKDLIQLCKSSISIILTGVGALPLIIEEPELNLILLLIVPILNIAFALEVKKLKEI